MNSSKRSRNAFALSLFGLGMILFSALPATARPSGYVGMTYRELPKGLESRAGWVIDIDRREPTYGGSVILQGQTQMLWLERYIRRDAAGRVTYQVVNVLNLPTISKSQVLAVASCQVNGKYDRRIAAIVEATDTEFRTKASRAWQLNIITGKIVPISTKGIACENPGWGV